MEELRRNYNVTPQSIANSIKEGSVIGYLCETENHTAGFALGDIKSGEVLVVAVHPDFERLGIGRKVLVAVCEHLFSNGHELIYLFATPYNKLRAHGFYRYLGWSEAKKIDEETEKMTLSRQTYIDKN